MRSLGNAGIQSLFNDSCRPVKEFFSYPIFGDNFIPDLIV